MFGRPSNLKYEILPPEPEPKHKPTSYKRNRLSCLESVDKHHVYFITCEGYVKIGIASDPQRRLGNLQTSNPFHMALHHTIECPTRDAALALERRCHKLAKAHHHRHEWYDIAALDLFETKPLAIEKPGFFVQTP